MTNPTPAEIAAIVCGLSKAEQKALLRTSGAELQQAQSNRGTLAGMLTDYSFRPARLTPLGIQVRAHLDAAGNGEAQG